MDDPLALLALMADQMEGGGSGRWAGSGNGGSGGEEGEAGGSMGRRGGGGIAATVAGLRAGGRLPSLKDLHSASFGDGDDIGGGGDQNPVATTRAGRTVKVTSKYVWTGSKRRGRRRGCGVKKIS